MLETIKETLREDEVILWSGTGNPKKWLSYSDYMYIPFSVMWCAFVVYWEYLSIHYQYPLIFHIIGIPFALMGIYMAIGRFYYKYQKKKNSCYVITNKRIIERYAHRIFPSHEMPVSELGRMVRFTDKDGYGVIIFTDINPAMIMKLNDGMEWTRRKTKGIVGFYDIPELEKVFELVTTLKNDIKQLETEKES